MFVRCFIGWCSLILTDDQDIELNERLDSPLGPMRHTKTLMQQAGALGTHSYVNVPICCPSRSNILSGRYAHNIRDSHYEPFPPSGTDASGVPGHSCGDEPIEKVTCKAGTPKCLPCGCMRMNVSSLGEFPEQTYPVYLKRAGCESRSRPPIRAPQFVVVRGSKAGAWISQFAVIRCQRHTTNADNTAYFGKYLNPPAMTKYCRNETLGPLTGGWPTGWDTFYGLSPTAAFFAKENPDDDVNPLPARPAKVEMWPLHRQTGMCDQASTPEGAYYDVNWYSSHSTATLLLTSVGFLAEHPRRVLDRVDSVAGEITHTGTKPEECAWPTSGTVSLVLHFDTLCAADTTSVIGNKTVAWIHANAKQDEPFFVAAATRAPHAPYLPPPWCAPHIYAVVCKRIAQSINLYPH